MAELGQKEAVGARALCPVAERCGGCPLIALSSEEQRGFHLREARDLLSGLADEAAVRFSPARSLPGYRNRVRMQVTPTGELAFFNPEKGSECAVLEPALRLVLGQIRERIAAGPELLLGMSHVELRAPDRDGRAGLVVSTPVGVAGPSESWALGERRLREALGPEWLVYLESHPRAAARRPDYDPASVPAQSFSLPNAVVHRVPLNGFMQVNHGINHSLVQSVVAGALQRGLRTVIDLYCGSGNFLLPLAAAGCDALGVELNEASVLAARAAASAQGLSARVYSEEVADWLRSNPGVRSPALGVVDPPRAGLGDAVEPLLQLAPRYIAICSCNPQSLARDVSVLTARGYRIESVELFEMFVNTQHVELLVWLKKDSSGSDA